jgi:WD repeat-containing protein 23
MCMSPLIDLLSPQIDFRLRIYDMLALPTRTVPSASGQRRSVAADGVHQSTMKVLKTIQGHEGRWTITDSHLSPDNHR